MDSRSSEAPATGVAAALDALVRSDPLAPLARLSFPALLLASGLLGLCLGASRPAWHVAIEPAQLLAGVVHYPYETPFSLYETRVWNLWHQLLAPLLAAGVTERALSIALSGAMGALAFAALSGFAAALGAHAALALALPFLVLLLGFAELGFGYPIFILGKGHTYGMAGLSWTGLTLAVLAAGRWRAGGALLALGPAVHVSLGFWLGIAVVVAGLARPRELRPHLPALVVGALMGAALTGASLAVHYWAFPANATIDPALADRYLDAFVRLWDAHRQPANLAHWSAFTIWCGALVALTLLRYAPSGLGVGATLSLRVMVTFLVLGFGSSILQRLVPLQTIPNALLIAMPTRLLNVNSLLFIPLMVAVLWHFRRDPIARLLLATLAAGSLLFAQEVAFRSYGLRLLGLGTLWVVGRGAERPGAARFAIPGLLAWVALAWLWQGGPAYGLGWVGRVTAVTAAWGMVAFLSSRLLGVVAPRLAGRAGWLDLVTVAALAGIFLWIAAGAVTGAAARVARLADPEHDPVLASAARGEGFLLVAPGVEQAQLLTRRPLLLDPGALDMLPYALAGGPDMERILAELYEIDFFRPPRRVLHNGRLPAERVRQTWQRRSRVEWAALGERFGISDVLVPASWRLQLDVLARDDGHVLYRLR